MAAIDQTKDPEKTICWGRGDSDAKGFIRQDSLGVAIDITGFTFKLTVNLDKAPTNQANEQFSVVGVITDATAGKFAFSPSTSDTDIAPGTYFYDIELIDSGGGKSTIIVAKALIVQDITKV